MVKIRKKVSKLVIIWIFDCRFFLTTKFLPVDQFIYLFRNLTLAVHWARVNLATFTWRERSKKSTLWRWSYSSNRNWSIIKWRSSCSVRLRSNRIYAIRIFCAFSGGGMMRRKFTWFLNLPVKENYTRHRFILSWAHHNTHSSFPQIVRLRKF